MSASAPGSSGAIVMTRRPSSSGAIASAPSCVGRPQHRRVVGALARRGEERPLEVEPQRLARRRRARPGSTARTRSANRGSSASGRDGAVGRNEVTPWRSSARAMPDRASASPVASWPPQPWTWTSMKPGATMGPPRLGLVGLDGRDPAVLDRDPARHDRRRAGRGGRRRRSVVIARPRRADPRRRPRTARRARSGPPDSGSRSPRARRPRSSEITRRSTSSGSPRRIPSRRASSCVAAAAVMVAVPRRRWWPARASASWSDPCSRSALSTITAVRRRRRAVSTAIGSPSAQADPAHDDDRLGRDDPERGGLVGASTVGSRGRAPRRRRPAPALHLVGERHQPVGATVGRRLPDEAAAARDPDDQPLVGEPLHRVAGGHPADPELVAQLGVGGQRVAGRHVVDALAQGALDAPPLRDGGRGGHAGRRRLDAPSAARSAPWTAAPIAPGPDPELGRDQRHRRRATSSSRAARAPRGSARTAGRRPPRRRRRSRPGPGEITVIMLAIPMPR